MKKAMVAVLVCSGMAMAQLAPPPSDKERDRATAPVPANQPAPPPAARPTPPPPKPQLVVPDIAVRDAEGKIVRTDLDQSIDIEAMKVNALFDNASWERSLPEIMAWMKEVEERTIENMDLLMEVEGGFFDRIDIEDRPEIAHAAELVKPLTYNAQLSKWLLDHGSITRAQFDHNNKIVAKYDQLVFADVLERPEVKAGGANERAAAMARHMFTTSTRETRRAYRRLVEQTALNFDRVIADAKIPVATLDKPTVAKIRDASASIHQRQEAVHALLKLMRFPEAQKLLSSTSKLCPIPEPAWTPKPSAEGAGASGGDDAEAR